MCPLDPRSSLVENLVHRATFEFTAQDGRRQRSLSRVVCPFGLSAHDEVYLWGLLALTLAQGEHAGELRATPHWCLRRLDMIDSRTKRGGRQYAGFAAALRRLSAVTYLSDGFYDPVRQEHRRVSFGFLSYSLPMSAASNRAWRIAWDPVFIEMVTAAGGQLRFDLRLYRDLDPASRRLFLLASKTIGHGRRMPKLDLGHTAVNLLGLSPTLAVRDMKAKVQRCLSTLAKHEVISDAAISKDGVGRYTVSMKKGNYFRRIARESGRLRDIDQPLFELLTQLGFEAPATRHLMRKYRRHLLQEWADITQAAQERFGPEFFKQSPMAYLVNNVQQAAQGGRGVPDWWHELRRSEQRSRNLDQESKAVLDRVRGELFSKPDNAGPDLPMASVGSLLRSG